MVAGTYRTTTIHLEFRKESHYGKQEYDRCHPDPRVENDPNCFLRMLDSPKQQRTRAARRQKDADRERLLSAIQVVSIAALDLVLILFIICTMF